MLNAKDVIVERKEVWGMAVYTLMLKDGKWLSQINAKIVNGKEKLIGFDGSLKSYVKDIVKKYNDKIDKQEKQNGEWKIPLTISDNGTIVIE